MFHHNGANSDGRLALFEGPGKEFVIKSFPIRKLNPGEILVKNIYTTICGSDLHTFCGTRKEACPTVLGHEIVGEILDISPTHTGFDLNGEPLIIGDRITWSIFASDPTSHYAQAGIPQKGENLFKYGHALAQQNDVFHGGMAEYCILRPHTGILKLPVTLPLNIASTVNCSIATVAGALRLAGNLAGKNVLITGMGHLGITCAAMCADRGAAWIGAADISAARLQVARQFGVHDTVHMQANAEVNARTLQALLPNQRLDLVIDMSGNPAAIEFGLNALTIGGIAIWVGAVFNTRDIAVNPERMIRNLLTIRGLHNYNFEDLQAALDFMERNWQRYPFGNMVEKEFPLDDAQAAFTYAVEQKPFRVGIKM
ncbi:alcohol dehydrogenase [Chitinophaga skermanii]|uniref:alcohol dehydrogenase n=1 Tax=Chitinophaga skermanii TaxID=331697 RepID=A0A327QWY1_9BACT|nr:zinc-binding dehydrogenase [Chitinophaga skermanii]RAJ08870.1 alcohol dehydrogenase [Chitinophaga skermanii]